MDRLRLHLLGDFELPAGPSPRRVVPTGKAQALLAYLAVTAGQVHPRDKLAALLWPDMAPGAARKQLRQTLFVVHKALSGVDAPVLGMTGDATTLRADAVETDVAAFEAAVASGTAAGLQEAADLYRGDLLAGLRAGAPTFDDWLAAERKRLRELALQGLERLLDHRRAAGASGAALVVATRLLALNPAEERTHRTLMRIHLDLGRHDAALRQYDECVETLRRALGVEPEAETRELYEVIRREHGTVRAVQEVAAVPLVGRDAELAWLHDMLTEAWDASAGGRNVIALFGEAGVGKTRLLTALAADAGRRGGAVLIGRSYESEQILPLGPWVSAVREAGALTRRDVLDSIDAGTRTQLARLFPELLPAGSPAAVGEPGDAGQLLGAFAALLRRLANARPLVVVLEDIHWADAMTLRLLGLLGERCAGAPIIVAVSLREEEPGTPALRATLDGLDAMGQLVRLAVAPLGRQDTVALIHQLQQADPRASVSAPRVEAIWESSRGNPFVVTETVRAIADGVDLDAREPLPLPARVRDTIGRRLGRLGNDARQLVGVAAVVGRGFDVELLRCGAAQDAPIAADAFEELLRRRVLHAVGDRFDFVHERIREVAHDLLLAPQRKLFHHRIAESLDTLSTGDRDAHALAVARHYREAGVPGRAVAAFRRAAAHAMSRSGYAEAVACLEQALEILRHLPAGRETIERAVDVRLELRTALVPLGVTDRALAYLREAQALAEQLGDERRLGRVSAYLCVEFRHVGDFARAIEAGERALSMAAASDDLSLQVTATHYLGKALWFSGAGRPAVELWRRNVTSLTDDQLRQRFGAPAYLGVLSMTEMASVLAELGDFAEARRVGARGLALAEELAQPFTTITARVEVATLFLLAGDFATAIAGLERARSLSDRVDFPLWRISVLSRLGYAYVLSGRIDDGLALLEETAGAVDRVEPFWRGRLLGVLAEGYLLAARMEDAARVAQRALAITPDTAPAARAWILWLGGEVAWRGHHADVESAAGRYREAAAVADRLELRLLRGHCHLGLGRVYRSARDPRAGAELGAAVDAFRAMGVDYWSSIAEAEVLMVSGGPGLGPGRSRQPDRG
jgi:DNA-binding SARP family transcriptional activator